MYAPRTRTRSLVVLGATVILSLAGCADGEPSGDSDGGSPSSSQSEPVYDFEPEGSEPSRSVTVTIPEDLREVAVTEDEELLVESYTITARDLESVDYCAVDLKPDYTEGAVDKLTASEPSHTRMDTDEERIAWRLGIDEVGQPIEALDEADPVEDAYFSKDRQTITLVQDCASAPSDIDRAGTVKFVTHDGRGGPATFAEVEFTVMADGTVAALGEIADYERDSNGDWIAN